MIKKGNLFFLIKSLSKAEKRNFNTYCVNKEISKNYLLLFDAYDRMEALDEAAIKKQFSGKAFVKQLHVTKNYLYKLLLKSLRNYHSELSKAAQLKDLLRNIEILYYKELYDQCHFEIQKAEKIALKYEEFHPLLELSAWKRKIFLAKYGNSQRADINDLLQSEANSIQKLQRQNQYWQLMFSVFDRAKAAPPLPEDALLQAARDDEPLQTKILHHHILYTYYVINNQPDLGIESLAKLLAIIEEQPYRIQEDPGSYITALNNQVSYYIHRRQYEQVPDLLKKVRAIPEKYQLKDKKKYAFNLLLRTYNVELEMYRDTRAYDEAIELIHQIEQFINDHKQRVPKDYLLMYWYQFANVFFMKRDFHNALKWVNAIIEVRFDGFRNDLESYARLLNLILHFELDNRLVLRYSIESCRRFLKKRKKMANFEKVLLKFFTKVCNAPKSAQPALLQQLEQQLFDPQQPLVNDHILDYLDFRYWLNSHLSN